MSAANDGELNVIFLCWGNICRSPMAERIAEKLASDAGITTMTFTSAATSTDEIGNPIDPPAARVLSDAGYRTSNHRAHQITPAEVRSADLIVGMEQIHLDLVRRLVPDADNLVLMTDFDPEAIPGSGVKDPWSGPLSGFVATRVLLERAVAGLLDHLTSSD